MRSTPLLNFGAAVLGLVGALLATAGAAHACPDWRFGPNSAEVTVRGPEALSGVAFRVRGGGPNTLTGCPVAQLFRDGQPVDAAPGRFATVPDFEVRFTGFERYRLELGVESACGAPILVNTARAQWHWDDGPDPEDAVRGPTGGPVSAQLFLTSTNETVLDVWVGAPDAALCDAVFYLRTIPLDPERS